MKGIREFRVQAIQERCEVEKRGVRERRLCLGFGI